MNQMPDSRILFVVPKETTALAEILSEFGGYLEYEHETEDFSDYLAENVGYPLTAEFEDQDNPSAPIYAIAMELEKQHAPYFGASPAYEERSRGDRFEGYVVYNISGTKSGMNQLNFPWREGNPTLDDRSLRIAGVSDEEIAKINAVFETPNAPAP